MRKVYNNKNLEMKILFDEASLPRPKAEAVMLNQIKFELRDFFIIVHFPNIDKSFYLMETHSVTCI